MVHLDILTREMTRLVRHQIGERLKQEHVHYCYSLFLPSNTIVSLANRVVYDGCALRGLVCETGTHISSQGFWNGKVLRFDACGSRDVIDMSALAA